MRSGYVRYVPVNSANVPHALHPGLFRREGDGDEDEDEDEDEDVDEDVEMR